MLGEGLVIRVYTIDNLMGFEVLYEAKLKQNIEK